MFTDPIKFFFTKSIPHGALESDLQIIADQLGAYTDSGFTLKQDPTSITITYNNAKHKAVLSIDPKSKYSDTAVSNQMVLTCERLDNTSVNLLRSIINGLGFRVYNPLLGGYATTDSNLIDLTTGETEEAIRKIFKIKKLTPLFRYINSLVFFARDPKDNSIHLCNRHLIQNAIEDQIDISKAGNFSVKVAPDLATFIALADRGIVPVAFYNTLFNEKGPVLYANFSGFNLTHVNCDIYLSPVFFYLDRVQQSFISLGQKKTISVLDKVVRGKSLKKYVEGLVKKHQIGPLIAVKIPTDIQFHTLNGVVYPRINISIFVDQR